ncbi:hypothetical protein Q5692_23915 [Microcoleus sp. C2C3]|uniref:hypothetical protein n=1 Tax=unclassified Microcoleus TaxID=2642155 RepID=UPI002FD59ACF
MINFYQCSSKTAILGTLEPCYCLSTSPSVPYLILAYKQTHLSIFYRHYNVSALACFFTSSQLQLLAKSGNVDLTAHLSRAIVITEED